MPRDSAEREAREKEAFEAWANSPDGFGGDLTPDSKWGGYADDETDVAWRAWLAYPSAAHRSPAGRMTSGDLARIRTIASGLTCHDGRTPDLVLLLEGYEEAVAELDRLSREARPEEA